MNSTRVATPLCAATFAAVFVAGCAAGANEVDGQPAAHTADAFEYTALPTTTTEPEPEPLAVDYQGHTEGHGQAVLRQRWLQRHRRTQPRVPGTLDVLENRSYSVTLEITGDESGPDITTIDGAGESLNVMPQLLLTPGPGVKPKATVTDVQEY